jgi:hypothetical protein
VAPDQLLALVVMIADGHLRRLGCASEATRGRRLGCKLVGVSHPGWCEDPRAVAGLVVPDGDVGGGVEGPILVLLGGVVM